MQDGNSKNLSRNVVVTANDYFFKLLIWTGQNFCSSLLKTEIMSLFKSIV